METISLCMIAPEFFPVWGGTGSYTIELIKNLPKSIDIHVVTLKRSIPGMSQDVLANSRLSSIFNRPLDIHYISDSKETFFYNLGFQIACLRNIQSLHKLCKFDIIHSHHCHMPDVFLRLLNKVSVPNVVTVHSTIALIARISKMSGVRYEDMEWSEKYTLLFYPILRSLERLYAKRVSRFIAVSNACKEEIMKDLNAEIERISVVYNGVDTELFHSPKKIEMDKKFSRPTVVYVGRMMAKKGIHVLIKAMSDVIRQVPQAHFLFVGGGNISSYRKIIREKGISEKNFSFLGHLGYFERPIILAEATVFVNPSLFENFSISILEAMSCNAAVVASDVGGNPEIVKSGRNGILVHPLDHKMLSKSIVSLLENESVNKQIGKEARRTVERSFSSKKTAEETCKVYKQLLG